jgi:S1-C subfamily serine protease
MSQNNGNNILSKLSDAMANAVEVAGAGTVMVNGRRRLPASGIAFASDLILTANHVLEREEDIPVILPDGSEFSSRLAGRDPGSDLAVLRLEKSVAALAIPASEEAHVGQIVLALGRPSPNGIQASLGVVSAIGGPVRTGRGGLLERYIRTDAIPYPGFSGGPLVDSSGKVLGMNTSGLSHGASLVVPAGLAWQLAESLAKHGSVRRGYLGVRSQPVEVSAAQQEALGRQQEGGLLLVSVEKRSPAEAGGLMVGDILVGFDGQAVTDPDELFVLLAGEVVDRPIQLEVLRGGQPTQITVTIGERK